MARKNSSPDSSELTGIDLISSLCPASVTDIVNYYLLNRKLAGKVPPISGVFVVDNFRIHLQPDEAQRLEIGGVNRYHALIEQAEIEYEVIPSQKVRGLVVSLRAQKKELESDVEAIDSLMADETKRAEDKQALKDRLKSEYEAETDEERLDVLSGEIETVDAEIVQIEEGLTKARELRGEKAGLLENVTANLAAELEAGEFEESETRKRKYPQFPFETFVS